jgi:hypothetical protein
MPANAYLGGFFLSTPLARTLFFRTFAYLFV